MRKLITLMLWSIALVARSATYYVDFDGGVDSNSGTIGTPWKHSPFDANATGNAASTTPAAGDTIQFKAGIRYKGSLTINSSGTAGNPITYKGTGWGTGKAIMDGSVLFTNTWTQCTSSGQVYGNANYANIWYATAAFTNQTSLNTLIQSNQMLPFAQITTPEKPVYYDVVTTWGTEAIGNVGLTTFTDTSIFTQTDVDFWRGAHLAIHKSPNSVSIKLIEGLNVSTDTITNAAHSNTDFYTPTPYEILGHPLHISYQGEYAVITNRIWMWPTNNSNPNNLQIYVGSLESGITIAGESYVTIDGFEITGYYGGLDVAYSGGAIGNTGSGNYTGLNILNCDVSNRRSMTQGGVLGLSSASDCLVMGNSIVDCLRSRGGIFNGTNIVVASNSWVRIGGTAIYYAGVAEGIVRSNYLFGIRGTHGNGISIYQGSRDCIVDRNWLAQCGSPITYEDGSNYLFNANFVDCSYGGIDQWGGMRGKVQWFNNTIVNMPGYSSALNVGRGTSNQVYLVNNLVDGMSWQTESNVVMRSHNIWLDYDRGYAAPTMGTGESINTNWASIFVDTNAAIADWRLLVTSPARAAGTNLFAFGVTNDLPGYIRSAWDMGAWEYQASSIYQGFSFGSGVKLIGPGSVRQ